MEACTFVNSQVEEVDSGSGVLVCEVKVRMKCIEAIVRKAVSSCIVLGQMRMMLSM